MPFNPTRCRILLVDSSMEVLALMSNLLRPYGFDLIVTSSAADAVRQAAEFQPHAVYMGLEYHDCNGWELVDRLRKVQGMSQSMFVGLRERKQGRHSHDGVGSRGFDRYLEKPPQMRDIVHAMTREVAR